MGSKRRRMAQIPRSWGRSHREHLHASLELPWAGLLAVLFPGMERSFDSPFMTCFGIICCKTTGHSWR